MFKLTRFATDTCNLEIGNKIRLRIQCTLRMIKSRRIRWTGHKTYMKENGNTCRVLVGNPEEKSSRKT
jgi:hypothetical protein